MKSEIPMVFIVGSSRSGTTMFNRILGNHPKVLGLHELHFIGTRWNINSDNKWGKEKAIFEAANLLATSRRSIWNAQPTQEEKEYAENLISNQSDSCLYSPIDIFEQVITYRLMQENKVIATDQTPRNILYVEQILELFPNAKVIQLVRDPRAVLFSQKNRWKQRGLGAKDTPLWNAIRVYVNYHAFTVTRLWLAAYKKGLSVRKHPNFLQLRFEDLVCNPEVILDDVCKFLGIEFNLEMLQVPMVGSSNLKHREDVKGISSEVVCAWEGRLSLSELWLCEKIAGENMAMAGYKPKRVKTPWVGVLQQLFMYPIHIFGVLIMNPKLAFQIIKAITRKK